MPPQMQEETDKSNAAPCGRLAFFPDMDILSSETLLWNGPVDDDLARCAAVREAIATHLTARQREVVEGYFFEGLSEPQLAAKLGIRQQVVHKCIYGTKRGGKQVGGALRKLRSALAGLSI